MATAQARVKASKFEIDFFKPKLEIGLYKPKLAIKHCFEELVHFKRIVVLKFLKNSAL